MTKKYQNITMFTKNLQSRVSKVAQLVRSHLAALPAVSSDPSSTLN